mmetsp:Transcript_16563/g.39413  ORF Transcript_16563/g.39413 Transcript_16563/m.39413 type:complete len:218 (-) Transcript_16563:362-1015(-)
MDLGVDGVETLLENCLQLVGDNPRRVDEEATTRRRLPERPSPSERCPPRHGQRRRERRRHGRRRRRRLRHNPRPYLHLGGRRRRCRRCFKSASGREKLLLRLHHLRSPVVAEPSHKLLHSRFELILSLLGDHDDLDSRRDTTRLVLLSSLCLGGFGGHGQGQRREHVVEVGQHRRPHSSIERERARTGMCVEQWDHHIGVRYTHSHPAEMGHHVFSK